jgi:magnesium-transporting ATPase (P-type)
MVVPLLATQILWINLITDSGPALAMGVDVETEDVMARPPRRPADRVIDGRMWTGIVSVGAVMAIVTLLAIDIFLPGGVVEGSEDVATARTAAFTTLVLAQLFNALASRSETASAFQRLFTNRWLWAALAFGVATQVLVVHVPILQTAFGTAPLSPQQWLICVGLASVVLWFDELRKLALRMLERRT